PHLDPLPSDIRQILSEAWTQVSGVTCGKQLGMTLEDTDLDLHCETDHVCMLHVFRNILENAVSACGDVVNISAAWSETNLDRSPALQISISDNGPGFSPEQRRKAFQPFFTTKLTGTGLGLVICRQIVERHGGRIDISENSVNGATVLITLPRSIKR
ncbi:MAG: HAMP domain-containing histidine kinase, partial [Planctomycetales bacterium]|nr:HAMP domain-containing histidine kinase [Planctomycetales bacterium]